MKTPNPKSYAILQKRIDSLVDFLIDKVSIYVKKVSPQQKPSDLQNMQADKDQGSDSKKGANTAAAYGDRTESTDRTLSFKYVYICQECLQDAFYFNELPQSRQTIFSQMIFYKDGSHPNPGDPIICPRCHFGLPTLFLKNIQPLN